jgi:hypothetical protein
MNGIQATTNIANWNRATQHVEAAIRSGRYINAETALIFAGPPRITDIGGVDANTVSNSSQNSALAIGYGGGGNALYPIGLVETIGLQQVQTVQKMFEIGARRSYQASGRVMVMGSMGRVMFNGASLLRVLYAYYPNTIQMANGKLLQAGSDTVSAAIVGAGGFGSTAQADQIFPSIYFTAGSFSKGDPENPGNLPNSFFINLMSELFSEPFGLGVILRDNRNNNYGALYLEDCFLTTHSWQVSSSSTLITEAVNFQCDAAIPMEFSTASGTLLPALPQ